MEFHGNCLFLEANISTLGAQRKILGPLMTYRQKAYRPELLGPIDWNAIERNPNDTEAGACITTQGVITPARRTINYNEIFGVAVRDNRQSYRLLSAPLAACTERSLVESELTERVFCGLAETADQH
jgi:hypothetical protein